MQYGVAGVIACSLVLAGCRSAVEREDLALDPRPTLKDLGVGDEVGDEVEELGVRTMRPLVAFFPVPLAPWVEDPEQLEARDALSGAEADLLGHLVASGDLFKPTGWWTFVHAPRRGGQRRIALIVTSYEPVLPGTEPGAVAAATASGVLRRTKRPGVYVLERREPGRDWRPYLLVLGPDDLVEGRSLASLSPTDAPPVELETSVGTYLGVPVAGEPELVRLPVFDGASTPPSLVGVKPLSAAVWIAAYDVPAGRRFGALTWSPAELTGPAWRALQSVPGPSVTELLRERAPASPPASYLVAQREDGRWIALLAFATPLCPATLEDHATPEAAVAAAEEKARQELAELRRQRAEEAARIAALEREAPGEFDAAMARGDKADARKHLLHLHPGDSARWTRFVQTYGLEAMAWNSQVDYRSAASNGVSRDVLDAAEVEQTPVYTEPQSDWDYFWNGPRDGSYVPAVSSSGSSWSPSPAAPTSSAPQKGPYDDYYQKQYDDTIRRYR